MSFFFYKNKVITHAVIINACCVYSSPESFPIYNGCVPFQLTYTLVNELLMSFHSALNLKKKECKCQTHEKKKEYCAKNTLIVFKDKVMNNYVYGLSRNSKHILQRILFLLFEFVNMVYYN